MVELMAKTNAQNIRAARQEDHRARLSEGQHLRHVSENITKIESLEVKMDGGDKGDEINYKNLQLNQFTLSKLKTATELRMKLIDKYVPSLKAVEHTGEGGGAIKLEEWLDTLE